MIFSPSPRGDASDNDSDDDEEEEEEEEDEDEDEEEGKDPSTVELTRAERRELKKKQGDERANKAGDGKGTNDGGDGDGNDGEDLISNPNHVTKKLNISDLSAPRELTRRERYVPASVSHIPALFVLTTSPFLIIFCAQRAEGEEGGQGTLLESKCARLLAGRLFPVSIPF